MWDFVLDFNPAEPHIQLSRSPYNYTPLPSFSPSSLPLSSISYPFPYLPPSLFFKHPLSSLSLSRFPYSPLFFHSFLCSPLLPFVLFLSPPPLPYLIISSFCLHITSFQLSFHHLSFFRPLPFCTYLSFPFWRHDFNMSLRGLTISAVRWGGSSNGIRMSKT